MKNSYWPLENHERNAAYREARLTHKTTDLRKLRRKLAQAERRGGLSDYQIPKIKRFIRKNYTSSGHFVLAYCRMRAESKYQHDSFYADY